MLLYKSSRQQEVELAAGGRNQTTSDEEKHIQRLTREKNTSFF